MEKTYLETLFAYNDWADRRIMAAAEPISRTEFIAPAPSSHGSLRATLAHILTAERIWRLRSEEGHSPTRLSDGSEFASFADLRSQWEAELAAWQAFINSLESADFARQVTYSNTRGKKFTTPLWQILLHVVNHGTQFRGEAAMLLSQMARSPGDLDLLAYLRGLE